MSEITQPRKDQTTTKPSTPPAATRSAKKRFKLIDFFLFGLLVVFIVVLGTTLLSKLSLKTEVSSAKVTADRIIHDVSTQNAKDALSVSDNKFQSAHSQTQLQSLFAAASGFASGTTTIVNQTVANDKSGKLVIFIYKYSGKTPYYFRVATSKADTGWQLVGLSGNPDESQLVVK